MAIPEWNEYGILPEGIHDADFDEVRDRLGFNAHRGELIEGLERTIAWIRAVSPIESLIVDGSFVTDKAHPGDIDAVAMIGNLTERNQREWVRRWQPEHERLKAENRVDLYPTVLGHGNDFSAYFQYMRPEEALERGAPLGVRKGLVRMAP